MHFIHCGPKVGSCKMAPSCPSGGLNQQPWGPVNIQVNQIFDWDVSVKGVQASETEDILIRTGAHHVFQNKCTTDISLVKQILFTEYQKKWSKVILSKPKLRTFSMIEKEYICENMFVLLQPKTKIIMCPALIWDLASAPWDSLIPGLCNYCDLNEIENEFHSVCYCTFVSWFTLKIVW